MIFPIFIPIMFDIRMDQQFESRLRNVVVNSCVICLIIAGIVGFSNFTDYMTNISSNRITSYLLVIIFLVGFIVFAAIGCVGAIIKSHQLTLIAFIIWIIVFFYWLLVCSITYLDSRNVHAVCVNHRCAESLWLNDWYWKYSEVVNKTAKKKVQGLSGTENFSDKLGDNYERIKLELNKKDDINSKEMNNNYELDKIKSKLQRTGQMKLMQNTEQLGRVTIERHPAFLVGSLLVFISFMLFFSMMGSMLWNFSAAMMLPYSLTTGPSNSYHMVHVNRGQVIHGPPIPTVNTMTASQDIKQGNMKPTIKQPQVFLAKQ